jgi:hypothetical protein
MNLHPLLINIVVAERELENQRLKHRMNRKALRKAELTTEQYREKPNRSLDLGRVQPAPESAN